MTDEQLLAIYDIALHEEYVRRQNVRFAVVPRVHGLRAVADAICAVERREVLAEVRAATRSLQREAGGMLPIAAVLAMLNDLDR